MPVYSCDKRIDCDTNLLTNYSSEGAEPYPPYYAVVYPPITDIPLDQEWSMPGCLYICKSYISQEDANLCALRQAVLCGSPPGEEIWYSAPATCTATCPDGTVFYYTVPAGMFIARTYAESLSQAQAYACLKAQEERFCIQDLPRCSCAGAAYSGTVTTDVGRTGLTWSVIGSLPPGLSLIGTPTSATVYGTPLLKGTYAFQLVATDANGNYAIKTFTIQVVEITTTALDPFTVGTPYSFQLTADGGSGNYSWRVAIGTLPDGLSLSLTGLISGTPTALATGGTLTFEVVDLTCESVTKQFFTPQVSMVTTGSTSIRTKRGWKDYGSGAILYKTVSYTGFQHQIALMVAGASPPPPTDFVAGARYLYSGFSQIDIYGNFISKHNKILMVACDNQPFPTIDPVSSVNNVGAQLLGYCWNADPGSCPTCDATESGWTSLGNFAAYSQYDVPNQMDYDGNYATITPTTYSYDSGGYIGGLVLLNGTENYPLSTYGGRNGAWTNLGSAGVWTATLSNEYTDADAAASAITYSNSSSVAENIPNYRTWESSSITNRSSRVTHVAYVLSLTNLVAGENYIAKVEWWYSNGAKVLHSYPFTAAGTTHQIIDSLPTPASNSTITVKKPSVVFA